MVFELLQRYKLRMNPLKCAFRVTSGKFLGFIVRHRGIEIDQAKVDAISKMPDPQNIHELKSFQGKLAYLRRFISNLAGRCQPFGHLMKKGAPFNWDQTCSDAFKSIKSYLAKPPILAALIPGKPLILYIATQETLLAQENSEDAMSIEIQPPWKMYFDGAAHCGEAGAGVVFITSQEEILPFSFTFKQCCSNNVAEYQALILGLEMAVHMKQLNLQVFGDSQLVINQLLGSYEVKKPELHPYDDYAQKLIVWLRDVTLQHVCRTENKKADALASLASTLTLLDQTQVTICKKWIVPLSNEKEYTENELEHLFTVSEATKDDWRKPIIDYMCYGILPENPRRRTDIRCRAPHFLYYKDTLYRRSFEGVLLRCLGEEEAIQALQEPHSGVCGSHQSGPKLHFHIKRMGYYWPTMVNDCLDYARRCDACQFHANFIHQSPEVLHPTIVSWPFDASGLDVVGPLPKYSGGHLYILAATDYFLKWVEAVALKEVKKENVANFIRRKSSMYHAAANGLAEAFNKTLCNLLKKVVSKSKRDWHERMEEALWAYRTTNRTPTQATPYSLAFEVEAVLPLEH
ncbi:uncharacterized protein LOC125863722 [Solanum stenotomum]|uniref:uncharacterized protein LOC125863722 n=1 Tax=Solanum stenotomum TaxID=172797 RepID=UPI0020D189B9|nr:uncharacterized protein LOC125863722 [Solanum stenotomum]